ncbi:hypothetical protein C8A03DRAFT_11256, partial [Achaetomium macrosporum]
IRLYQAPVESDIQSKPSSAADVRLARMRSSIRRAPDRNEDRIRERRRRVLAAAAYNLSDERRGSLARPSAIPPATTDASGTRSGSEHGRRALGDVANRIGGLDDRVVAMFGERWAHLHAESNPSRLRDDDNDPSPMLTMAVGPEFLPRRSRLRPEPTYALSSMRSTQAANHPSRNATRSAAETTGFRATRRPENPLLGTPHSHPVEGRPDAARVWPQRVESEAADFDGLGDRNRSLSPEGDNVWDTLLSTLTPDPQPPSVGSSFASASASAAATQRSAAASSRTSFTTPDTAEDSTFEPPCESGCDNSDTEGDEEEEEEEEEEMPASLMRLGRRRTYADVVRDDDPLELLGGIGGMQRIVRNLARREDIPDEWWAEAGLSRTLSREASAS